MGIVLVLIVVGIVWFGFSLLRGRATLQVVEQTEVNERNRLAHLVLGEMKKWERQDPEHVGVYQSLEQGTKWVLERSVGMAPLLANMVAKAAYCQILKEKIETRIGLMETAAFAQKMSDDARRLDKVVGTKRGVDKWWDDVDYEYETLFEKAKECGALTVQFALSFYGREPKAKKKALTPGSSDGKAPPPRLPPPSAPAPPSASGTGPLGERVSCGKCSTRNDLDATFCKGCGERLDGRRRCASCETLNDVDAQFCKKCGGSIATTDAEA